MAASNAVQVLVNTGKLNDPDFERALEKASVGREVEELGGDYFHPVLPKDKKELAAGKVFLVANKRGHGMGTAPVTYRAMMAAEKLARSGKKATTFAGPEKDLEKIAEFLKENVMQSSISDVGTKGSRGGATDEEILMRAAALFGDVERGYDPKTGVAFNAMHQKGLVPLDAGHFMSHIANPELSNDPSNIGYQNQYENKGQASAEKIAGNEGRQATDEELADMLYKSIINRTVEDVKLPSRNTRAGKAEYEALMSRINAKIN